MYIYATTMEDSMEIPQKNKNRTTMWATYSTFEYLSKKYTDTNPKRYLHPHVHHSIIYNSQDMETT